MPPTPRTRQMARECLGARIRVLARLVTGIYENALRPFGIRITQSSILTVVANHGPISPGLLCKILEMEKSTLSRDLQGIREAGWIETTTSESARGQIIHLTESGRAMLERIHPAWQKAQKEAEKILGPVGSVAIAEVVNTRWSNLRKAPE
jgi:DNA-binding MarR family transcriptional regulator